MPPPQHSHKSQPSEQISSPYDPSSDHGEDDGRGMFLDLLSHRVFNAIPERSLVWVTQILFRPGPGQRLLSPPHMRASVVRANGKVFRGAENEVLQGDLTVSGNAERQGGWTFEFPDLAFKEGTQGNKYVLEFALHLDGGKVAGSLQLGEISVLALRTLTSS